jgi:site-specific recombinase XerD
MPPARPADDGLAPGTTFLWDNALSKSTLATYSSALSTFLRYLALSSQAPHPIATTLPNITERTLINFVTYCKNVLNFKFDTVKLYLAGIRFHYIKSNNIDVLANKLQLNYILRGVKKTQSNLHKGLRLPITFNILKDLCATLSVGMFTRFIDCMLLAIFSTAFYGFLRCGEFTVSHCHDACLLIMDVAMSDDMSNFTLLLRSSKTDPFAQGVQVTIFNTHPLQPVTLMHNYISLRQSLGAVPHSPLFIESPQTNQPLTRSTFISFLKRALSTIGYSDNLFSGHSFRIGACTSGAAGGVEDHLLQVLGRWQSTCYTRYIRTHSSTIRRAQNLMNTDSHV